MTGSDEICGSCSGSGEGMHDGTTCYACNGRGILSGESRAEREADRADYLYDRWKDEQAEKWLEENPQGGERGEHHR